MDIIDFDLFVLSKIELIIKLKFILVEVKINLNIIFTMLNSSLHLINF